MRGDSILNSLYLLHHLFINGEPTRGINDDGVVSLLFSLLVKSLFEEALLFCPYHGAAVMPAQSADGRRSSDQTELEARANRVVSNQVQGPGTGPQQGSRSVPIHLEARATLALLGFLLGSLDGFFFFVFWLEASAASREGHKCFWALCLGLGCAGPQMPLLQY